MTGAERDELILSLKPLVLAIARSMTARLPPMVRVDDIISAGWVGAIHAVDKYDPAKAAGASLATFAKWRIYGAILDYLRDIDPVSRDERRKLKRNDESGPFTFSITRSDVNEPIYEIKDERSLVPIRRLEARLDLAKIIRRASPNVKPRSLRIVRRHAQGETMKNIGKREGINESRVSQICKKTLAELRHAA